MANGKQQGKALLKEALTILAVLLGTGLVLVSIFLISRCDGRSNDAPPVHSATVSDVAVTDTETGISYTRCPIGIGANTLKDKFLAIGDEDSGIVLYTIMFEDSARFISEAKDALGGSYVYRAKGEKEITLEGFAPIAAGIFMDGINAPIDNFYGKDAVDNATGLKLEDGTKYVEYIKNALLNGKQATPTGEFTDTEYYIRLYSKAYPGLYYEVLFCTDVNGVAYLRDMVTEKLVVSPDELTVRING